MKKAIVITLVALFLGNVSGASAYTSPGSPRGFVNDFAGIVDANTVKVINDRLSSFEASTSIEIAVVTVPSLGGDTIENYAVKLFQEWGIGKKKEDSGLLILVAPNDRQVRIEVGYGLEGAITDLEAGNVVNSVMTPSFKKGDYSSGISQAVNAVIGIISNSPEAAIYSSNVDSSTNTKRGSGMDFGALIFFAFFVLSVIGRLLGRTKSWWLGGVLGAGVGAIVGLIWGFVYYGIIATIVLGLLGLLFDFIVSKGGGHGPGGFWLGGPWGGISGRGGGGFGGFGGGMSGGGGASGRW